MKRNKQIKRRPDEYDSYVTHPRYGKRPQVTGLDTEPGLYLHWHSPESRRIPNTAVAADLTKQTPATIAVARYFDVKRQCRKCGKPFLFFALEQKHWYEGLGFPLEADCVHCPLCRKTNQRTARARKRYEELTHTTERTINQSFEMADCLLFLLEEGVFHSRKTEHVRALLHRIPADKRSDSTFVELTKRLKAVEANQEEGRGAP